MWRRGRASTRPFFVHHYFGTKHQLFVAAMGPPRGTRDDRPALLGGRPTSLGTPRPVLLGLWEAPTVRPLVLGALRSATTDPVAARMLRQLLARGPDPRPGQRHRPTRRDLRATLVGSPQLIGLALARYIVAVEPLASAPTEVLVRAVGPTIQRYLAEDLAGEPIQPTGPIGSPGPIQPTGPN